MAKPSIAAIVEKHIRESGLPLLGDPSIASVGIHLQTKRRKSDVRKIGTSRMGGCPDLPLEVDWPEGYGEPIGFVGQINLGEVPDTGQLPSTGLLSFFSHYDCETDDRSTYRVFYFDDLRKLKRRPFPDDIEDTLQAYPASVKYSEIMTLPQLESIPTSAWKPTKADRSTYLQLMNELMEDVQSQGSSMTWLLGNAHCFYGDMQAEISLMAKGLSGNDRGAKALMKRSHDEWTLLLQVGTDEHGTGYAWGDMGTLFFWIRNEDLANGNFDNVWAMVEGG